MRLFVPIILVAILGGIAYTLLSGMPEQSTNDSAPTSVPTIQDTLEQNSEVEGESAYTLTEIANHDSSSDCWMAINNRVYDMTEFIPQHPGGSKIVAGCGLDATTLFETQGGKGEHNSMATSMLENYYIGDLTQ